MNQARTLLDAKAHGHVPLEFGLEKPPVTPEATCTLGRSLLWSAWAPKAAHGAQLTAQYLSSAARRHRPSAQPVRLQRLREVLGVTAPVSKANIRHQLEHLLPRFLRYRALSQHGQCANEAPNLAPDPKAPECKIIDTGCKTAFCKLLLCSCPSLPLGGGAAKASQAGPPPNGNEGSARSKIVESRPCWPPVEVVPSTSNQRLTSSTRLNRISSIASCSLSTNTAPRA